MLKFSLVENALDSLEHANDDLQTGDYKRVILDLAHAAELLLKERLRIIHPAFVLSNIDKYPSQHAHTVNKKVLHLETEISYCLYVVVPF